MKYFRGIILLIVLLAAACSGQSPSATLPSGDATTVSQPQPDLFGGTFLVQFSGNINAALSSDKDKVEFFKIPNEGDGYNLSFTSADGLLNAQILFYTADPPPVGTAKFSLDVIDGSDMAMAFDQSGGAPRSFTPGDGQVTIDHAGDYYSGSFAFIAKGGQAGSLDQSITVGGSFKDIQLQQ